MEDILKKAIQKEIKKSIGHSIKLKEEVSKKLNDIANKNNISFNKLVSNILEEVLNTYIISESSQKEITKSITKKDDFEIIESIEKYIKVKMKNDNSIKYYRVLKNEEYREVKEVTYRKQKNKIK